MFLRFHLSPTMARGNFSLKVWGNQEKSLLCKHLLRLWDQSSESSLPGKLPMQIGYEKGLVHLNYRLLHACLPHACLPLDPTPVRFQLSNGRFTFSFPTTSECTPGREFQKCICLRKSILKVFIISKELKFYFETLSSLMKDFDSCNHDTIHVLFIILCTVHSYLSQANSSLLCSLLECLVMSFSLMWHWLISLWFPWRRFSPSCFQLHLSYIFILYPASCHVLHRNIYKAWGHQIHFPKNHLKVSIKMAHEAGIWDTP